MRKKKENQNPLTKRDKSLYYIFFGSIIALLTISIFSYYKVFLMLHNKENLYFAEPSTSGILLFGLWIVLTFFFVWDADGKTRLQRVPIKSLFKDKRKLLFRFCIHLSVLFVLLCVVLFANTKYYSYYNDEGYFRNGDLVFSCEDVTAINVGAEKILIISGVKSAMPSRYGLEFSICTDNDKIVIDSDQFYGYEKIYDFLKANKNVVNVDFENFSELIDFENRNIFSHNSIEYINKITEEFS